MRGFTDKPVEALEVHHATVFSESVGDELRRKMRGGCQRAVRLRRGTVA